MISANAIRCLLAFAAATEVLTGMGLMAAPSIVVKLLLNGEIAGAGLVVGRVAGVALLSLGVACWPTRGARTNVVPLLGYNLLVAIYLVGLGLRGEHVGVLLWPAAALHAALFAALSLAWRTSRRGAAQHDGAR